MRKKRIPNTEKVWVARDRFHRTLREESGLSNAQLMYELRDDYAEACNPLDAKTGLP